MTLEKFTLQLDGIDVASLREDEIIALIEKDVEAAGGCTSSVDVYINIEGTAVTAYYTCDTCNGAVRLNP